eukprot:596491-Alexandrium_andersonii.AAC.1
MLSEAGLVWSAKQVCEWSGTRSSDRSRGKHLVGSRCSNREVGWANPRAGGLGPLGTRESGPDGGREEGRGRGFSR